MTPPAPQATALIAEDEPLLAQALVAELARAWPQLEVLACVGDGQSAVENALALLPDILFFDIRMPGLSGLDAAATLLNQWPDTAAHKPFPQLVFVTAYDQYAIEAFETQAVDYLRKPVHPDRLKKTIQRLQNGLALRQATPASPPPPSDVATLHQALEQMRGILNMGASTAGPQKLQWIQASQGNSLHMVSINDVVYFEAADKYVQVMTAKASYLIRTPIKELLDQLDPQLFWQVHRGTVVRVSEIASAQRDEAGKLSLLLRGRPERLAVSRLYAHQFKAM